MLSLRELKGLPQCIDQEYVWNCSWTVLYFNREGPGMTHSRRLKQQQCEWPKFERSWLLAAGEMAATALFLGLGAEDLSKARSGFCSFDCPCPAENQLYQSAPSSCSNWLLVRPRGCVWLQVIKTRAFTWNQPGPKSADKICFLMPKVRREEPGLEDQGLSHGRVSSTNF